MTITNIQRIADAMIGICEQPNQIETGFTPTPIPENLHGNFRVNYDEVDQIMSLIADRFPVFCTSISVTRHTITHYFVITNCLIDRSPASVWVTFYRDGSVSINQNGCEFTTPDNAYAYAKGMNAIAEWVANR